MAWFMDASTERWGSRESPSDSTAAPAGVAAVATTAGGATNTEVRARRLIELLSSVPPDSAQCFPLKQL